MKRKTLKKALSAFLSLLMCMMTLLSISTPVFAATTVDAYMVDFPRDGDSNYSATAWGPLCHVSDGRLAVSQQQIHNGA